MKQNGKPRRRRRVRRMILLLIAVRLLPEGEAALPLGLSVSVRLEEDE